MENVVPGIYEVTELAENKYEPQATKRVTVVSGQTATVTFDNKLKRGDLTVTKTAEDGFVEDKTFHLYGHQPVRAAGGRICHHGQQRRGPV